MPRICASNNDPYDFCQKCFPKPAPAKFEYGDMGEGPDGRGDCYEYDASHPDYNDDEYKCYDCGNLLEGWDNYAG